MSFVIDGRELTTHNSDGTDAGLLFRRRLVGRSLGGTYGIWITGSDNDQFRFRLLEIAGLCSSSAIVQSIDGFMSERNK